MIKNIFALFIGFLISIILSEIFLRFINVPPLEKFDNQEIPVMLWAQEDPIYGWKNKVGKAVSPEKSDVIMNFNSDNSRFDPNFKKNKKNILVLGCSYPAGFSIDDNLTFSSILSKNSDYNFINFSVPGYSNYQNLLQLKEKIKENYSTVLIFFLDHHLQRNVSNYEYSKFLRVPGGGFIIAPHLVKDKEKFIHINSSVESPWLFEHHLSLIHFIHTAYNKFKFDVDEKNQIQIAEYIFNEMLDLANKYKKKIYFIGLEYDDEYSNIFSNPSIKFIDCRINKSKGWKKGGVPLNYRVDNLMKHPNEKAHIYWANCIQENVNNN